MKAVLHMNRLVGIAPSMPMLDQSGQRRSAALQGSTTAFRGTRAFTLVELLLVISILTIIIVALYSVFDHTQRAFRGSLSQVDVTESGRAAMDLIARDLQQAIATGQNAPNFATQLYYQRKDFTRDPKPQPFTQLLGVDQKGNLVPSRINLLDEVYFLTRSNNFWVGNSYFVSTTISVTNTDFFVSQLGVGTLYRSTQPCYRLTNGVPIGVPMFETTATDLNVLSDFHLLNLNKYVTNTNQSMLWRRPTPVIDGVVHFQVRPVLGLVNPVLPSLPRRDSPEFPFVRVLPDVINGESEYFYFSNGLPAYVDVELGILEPQVFDRLKAMPNASTARDYLQKRAGRVHLFRQRIPLRASALP
jgi:prepilin-type N-terminal cleavage/methylation domain-containing protein